MWTSLLWGEGEVCFTSQSEKEACDHCKLNERMDGRFHFCIGNSGVEVGLMFCAAVAGLLSAGLWMFCVLPLLFHSFRY